MKSFAVAAALLLAAPAFAITANSGTVNTGAKVTVGTVVAADADTDTATGAPAALGSASSASLNDGDAVLTANSSVRATWASATQGSATMNWGWNANNPGSTNLTEVDTRTAGNNNWIYDFTTGAAPSSFNVKWTLDASDGSTFGIQGVYGSGGLPFFVTPSQVAPVDGSGSFSVALNPFTTYSLTFFNFGNLSNGSGGLTSTASAQFTMDWTIVEGGVVPEPSSWAMLIAGFGLVGASARRRRRITA